jgi:hypothetical protein
VFGAWDFPMCVPLPRIVGLKFGASLMFGSWRLELFPGGPSTQIKALKAKSRVLEGARGQNCKPLDAILTPNPAAIRFFYCLTAMAHNGNQVSSL